MAVSAHSHVSHCVHNTIKYTFALVGIGVCPRHRRHRRHRRIAL